ncbi:hypothetical protein KIW84_021613 [Lathyrus oleraceus]|uniref:Association with the SNF1 complex (ASC) domain-containing protein n=1 Tax=Pisum sativum TaxID=3888 RepID=A0A9D5BA49_PEA|nr:hypothetical protein KIW84_021613 [Pisum sativum]
MIFSLHHTHSWTQTTFGYEDMYTQHTIPTLITWSYGDIGSISGFEPPQSPTSSYDNSQLSSEDYVKEPPLVPPHFATAMLNVRTKNMEIQPPTPKPQHGVLNHLYIKKRVVTRRKSYTPMMKVTSLSTDSVDDAAVIDDLIAKVREVPVKSATRISDGADPV